MNSRPVNGRPREENAAPDRVVDHFT